MFRYCDFFNCAIGGVAMNSSDRPNILSGGNIAWPSGWTEEDAKRYRKDHGLQQPSQEAAQSAE